MSMKIFDVILKLFFILIIFSSCNNSSDKEKELDLKAKELALKEKELELKEIEAKKVAEPIAKPVSNNSSNLESLLGTWCLSFDDKDDVFIFNRNGTFTRNYFDDILKGTYKLENNQLTIYYDNRPKDIMKLYKSKEFYYIDRNEGDRVVATYTYSKDCR